MSGATHQAVGGVDACYPRRRPRQRRSRRLPCGVICGLLLLVPWEAGLAADDAELADLRRAVRELQEQNRSLQRRLEALEGRRASRRAVPPSPETPPEPPPTALAPAQPRPATPPLAGVEVILPAPRPDPEREARLEARVRELELGRAAQENATRRILRDALTTLGPNINQFMALGGAIEVRPSRTVPYQGSPQQTVQLSTAELDFDIKLNEWVYGSMILGFDSGSTRFQTETGTFVGVERFNVERAILAIGDPLRFPLVLKGGRDVLNFGTSTGIARLDTLSLSGPLTTDAFETRDAFVGLEFAFPTPPLEPLPPPVVIPPVRPLVINPLMASIAERMGYQRIGIRPPPLVAVRPPAFPPPFYGSIYLFQGDRNLAPTRGVTQNINASLGFITRGFCGRTLEQLRDSLICPWSFDIHVDYISSVFDSNFLRTSYEQFLTGIGQIPGIAVSVKAGAGPFSLVGEYNTALEAVRFVDDAGRNIRMRPSAWQVSLGYQFDWNPWIEKIGELGNYIAITYSGTSGLAGVTQLINGVPTRVGSLPQARLAFTIGEWFLPGARFAVEFAMDWDYPKRDGGTGRIATGIIGSFLITF